MQSHLLMKLCSNHKFKQPILHKVLCCQATVLSRSDLSYAFSTYNVYNIQQLYWDITPFYVKDLYALFDPYAFRTVMTFLKDYCLQHCVMPFLTTATPVFEMHSICCSCSCPCAVSLIFAWRIFLHSLFTFNLLMLLKFKCLLNRSLFSGQLFFFF